MKITEDIVEETITALCTEIGPVTFGIVFSRKADHMALTRIYDPIISVIFSIMAEFLAGIFSLNDLGITFGSLETFSSFF